MKDLTKGKEFKLILMFALPMLIGNVFQQLYNIVDSAIVGNYIGKQALAAVGASFPIIFTLISLIIGITIGSTIIISQYFGAKQFGNVRKSVDTINVFLLIASIITSALGIIFSREIFVLIDLPKEIIPLAVEYLDIYLLGLPFMFGFQGISAILRGVGDTRTPLYFLIISTLLNIALDFIFVLGFNYGISGVAWATIISQSVALLAAIIWVRKNKLLNFRIKGLVFDIAIFKESVRIGLPSGMQQIFVSLGMMAIFGIVNQFGTNVIAAYSVAMRIDSLAILPAMVFSSALSAFVGQNIGANKLERVKKGLYSTILMTVVFSLIITLIITVFGEQLMLLFIKDMPVVNIGKEYLVIVSSFYVLFAVMFTLNGVMQGAGDTLIPMFITLIALWFVRVPVAYFLSSHIGETGIWWSLPAAWFVGLLLSTIYYKTGRWKRKAVVKNTEN
jgi:putative MATE family efflux protein